MLDNKEIIIVGYSGHGLVVSDAALASEMNLKYYSEINEQIKNPYNLVYLGDENKEDFAGWNSENAFILGIGDNAIRYKIAHFILSKNKKILNVIHPTASISDNVLIGKGNFISKNTSINPLAQIGNFCIINTGAIIEHECIISDAVHIAPGAVLAGNVKIGERSFVGANAVIKQDVTIGKDVIIGAGSVIINDVEDGQTVVGNPGRIILK
ncbi:MAG: acetyltransferase [Flavobacterium sp.]|uniref:acetyltransferase n=1 Tax=Flavobacterium sp. TaxID=239 RepID=UPI003265747D